MVSRMNHSRYQFSKAYTLIELLIAVAIAGVIASIGVWNYFSITRYQALLSLSSSLSEWIYSVKHYAQENDTSCSVSVSVATKELLSADPAGSECIPSFRFSNIVSSKGLLDKIKLCYRNLDPLVDALGCIPSTTSSTASVVFSRRGTVGTDAVFEFLALDSMNQKSKTCVIVIKPLGLIRNGKVTNNYCKPFD